MLLKNFTDFINEISSTVYTNAHKKLKDIGKTERAYVLRKKQIEQSLKTNTLIEDDKTLCVMVRKGDDKLIADDHTGWMFIDKTSIRILFHGITSYITFNATYGGDAFKLCLPVWYGKTIDNGLSMNDGNFTRVFMIAAPTPPLARKTANALAKLANKAFSEVEMKTPSEYEHIYLYSNVRDISTIDLKTATLRHLVY
jgi:hypothetical protein